MIGASTKSKKGLLTPDLRRFGAVCPWASFVENDVIPIWRLIFLGILILVFRRLPVIFALHWNIWQIEEKQQALFVGFFGPIGVSAVFYLYISLEFLRGITVDGKVREDAARLEDVFTVVVWFLAVCSIVSPRRELDLSIDLPWCRSFMVFQSPSVRLVTIYLARCPVPSSRMRPAKTQPKFTHHSISATEYKMKGRFKTRESAGVTKIEPERALLVRLSALEAP